MLIFVQLRKVKHVFCLSQTTSLLYLINIIAMKLPQKVSWVAKVAFMLKKIRYTACFYRTFGNASV